MDKIIEQTSNFKNHYKQRIKANPAVRQKTLSAIELFSENRKSPDLKDHQLKGKMNTSRAFSVTEEIRIVYRETQDKIIFLDIGNHSQVYIK